MVNREFSPPTLAASKIAKRIKIFIPESASPPVFWMVNPVILHPSAPDSVEFG